MSPAGEGLCSFSGSSQVEAENVHEESDIQRARIVILGSGFSGLGMALRLKHEGITDFVILERADELGGTWRDNVYPGCQCDVPSHLYSFSFRPNPEWSRTYSMRPEIQAYLKSCAEEAGIHEHVRFGHEVLSASWNESDACWWIETSHGTWVAKFLISAHGGLHIPAYPNLPGMETFSGRIVHSAAWDPDLELAGKRVGVVGTGASAIQIVPGIQPVVKKLDVFQRTPAWILPHTDRPITGLERRIFRRFPAIQRTRRSLVYWGREALVVGMTKNKKFLKPLRALATGHLRRQVRDRDLRRRLTPRYEPGCKRLLLSNTFYPAVAASNTELVTEQIEAVTSKGMVTADGVEHELDVIVFATGFRVTDNPMVEHIKGRDGRSLGELWRETGIRAYLGTTVDNFPNLFVMTGPNTGIGHTSLLVMVEAQIRYVMSALRYAADHELSAIEVRPEAVERFNEQLQRKMRNTVWTQGGCASWYLDSKGRNSTLWPDFTFRFVQMTRRFDAATYDTRK